MIIWHPDIHYCEGEKLHFCLIDSYLFYIGLENDLAVLEELSGGRLSIYGLYGRSDLLLKFWGNEQITTTIRGYIDKRLLDLVAPNSSWLTVTDTFRVSFTNISPLDIDEWVGQAELDTMMQAQNNWAGFPHREAFLKKQYCFPAERFNPQNQVKAFVTFRIPHQNVREVTTSLLSTVGEKEIFGIYQTDGETGLFMEAYFPDIGSLHNFTNRIRGFMARSYHQGSAITYLVSERYLSRSQMCGFEILGNLLDHQRRLFEVFFPDIKELLPKDRLRIEGELIDWIDAGLLGKSKIGGFCHRITHAVITKNQEQLSNTIIAIGRTMETHLRKEIPLIATEMLGEEWLKNIRKCDSTLNENPKYWTLGTQLTILSNTPLKESRCGIDKDTEYPPLNDAVNFVNEARHDINKIKPDHNFLRSIRPALEIMLRRQSELGFI